MVRFRLVQCHLLFGLRHTFRSFSMGRPWLSPYQMRKWKGLALRLRLARPAPHEKHQNFRLLLPTGLRLARWHPVISCQSSLQGDTSSIKKKIPPRLGLPDTSMCEFVGRTAATSTPIFLSVVWDAASTRQAKTLFDNSLKGSRLTERLEATAAAAFVGPGTKDGTLAAPTPYPMILNSG